jgi:hypothetical protein
MRPSPLPSRRDPAPSATFAQLSQKIHFEKFAAASPASFLRMTAGDAAMTQRRGAPCDAPGEPVSRDARQRRLTHPSFAISNRVDRAAAEPVGRGATRSGRARQWAT